MGKLNTPARSGTKATLRSIPLKNGRRNLMPRINSKKSRMGTNSVYLIYLTSKTQALFAPSRLRDREASFPWGGCPFITKAACSRRALREPPAVCEHES
jgi:hypothetical protein